MNINTVSVFLTSAIIAVGITFSAYADGTYYLIGGDSSSSDCSFSSSAAGAKGWNTDPNATAALTHTVSSDYDYVVRGTGSAFYLRTHNALADETFAGKSLTLDARGTLFLKNANSANTAKRVTVPRLVIGNNAIVGIGNTGAGFVLDGGIVFTNDSRLVIFSGLDSSNAADIRQLEIASTVTGAGVLAVGALDVGNPGTHTLTLSGDFSGFAGTIASLSASRLSGTFRLVVKGAYGGTVTSLPILNTAKDNLIAFDYDELVDGAAKGLSIATATPDETISSQVTFVLSESKYVGAELALMTFPAGLSKAASDFTVRRAETFGGPAQEFVSLRLRSNTDGTVTLMGSLPAGYPKLGGKSPIKTQEQNNVEVLRYADFAYGERGNQPGEGGTAHHGTGQLFDVYARSDWNTKESLPIMLSIHGGAWSGAGDKDGSKGTDPAVAFDALDSAYAAYGDFMAFNMNYIMQPVNYSEAPNPDATIINMLRDVDAMVSRIKTFLPENGLAVPKKIAIGGNSAGAQLAVLYAFDGANPSVLNLGLRHELPIGFVVDTVGPVDLSTLAPNGVTSTQSRRRLLCAITGISTSATDAELKAALESLDATPLVNYRTPLTIGVYAETSQGSGTDGAVSFENYERLASALGDRFHGHPVYGATHETVLNQSGDKIWLITEVVNAKPYLLADDPEPPVDPNPPTDGAYWRWTSNGTAVSPTWTNVATNEVTPPAFSGTAAEDNIIELLDDCVAPTNAASLTDENRGHYFSKNLTIRTKPGLAAKSISFTELSLYVANAEVVASNVTFKGNIEWTNPLSSSSSKFAPASSYTASYAHTAWVVPRHKSLTLGSGATVCNFLTRKGALPEALDAGTDGGVIAVRGTLNILPGAAVCDNRGQQSPIVAYLKDGRATVNMSGGEIARNYSQNTKDKGVAIWMDDNSSSLLNLSGGSIHDNLGYGTLSALATSGAEIRLSGTPVVKDNHGTTKVNSVRCDANIIATGTKQIVLCGNLEEGAEIYCAYPEPQTADAVFGVTVAGCTGAQYIHAQGDASLVGKRKGLDLVWANAASAQDEDLPPDAPKPVKILAIGNSYSRSVMQQLPAVARSLGVQLDIMNLYYAGCRLASHWDHHDSAGFYSFDRSFVTVPSAAEDLRPETDSLDAILAAEEWDIVTLQQASDQAPKLSSFEPYFGNLVSLIREKAPTAEIIIQQTWTRAPGHSTIANMDECDAQYDAVLANYSKMTNDYSIARMIPVGFAVQLGHHIYDEDFYLQKSDYAHLSAPEGEYLQACVWAGYLFGKDVTTLAYEPGGIDSTRAATIRSLAQMAVNANDLTAYKTASPVDPEPPARIDGDRTWTGAAGDSVWETDGNWSPVGAPLANENVSITMDGGTLTFTCAATPSVPSSGMKTYTFTSINGGHIATADGKFSADSDHVTFAFNAAGGDISLGASGNDIKKGVLRAVITDGGSVKINSITTLNAGSVITNINGTLKTNWSIPLTANVSTYIAGTNSLIRPANGGMTIAANHQMTIMADPARAISNPYFSCTGTGSSAKMTITSGFSPTVDVSAFKNVSGVYTNTFVSFAKDSGSAMKVPTANVVGAGAANCTVSFVKKSGTLMYMIITSSNAPLAPPVIGCDNGTALEIANGYLKVSVANAVQGCQYGYKKTTSLVGVDWDKISTVDLGYTHDSAATDAILSIPLDPEETSCFYRIVVW